MNLYGGIAKPLSAGILLLFCLYLGLYHGAFGVAIAIVRRAEVAGYSAGTRGALLLAPFAWVVVEFARAKITGFPWDLLGVTQVDNLVLTRLATITGCYGLSFVVAAVNAMWLLPVSVRERRHIRTTLTVIGVALILGYVVIAPRLVPPAQKELPGSAVLVQENLLVGAAAATEPPMSKQELLRTFTQLSLVTPGGGCAGIPELPGTHCTPEVSSQVAGGEPAQHGPNTDIVIWPESPAPFEEADPEFHDALSQLARTAASPVIVGNVSVELDRSAARGVRLQNSADFFAADGRLVGRYDKMHLVPFGEYVPFKRFFFFAGNLLADVGEFSPGHARVVFPAEDHRYGAFICYESIFGDEVREYSNLGADVLVNISNDGWYGDTSAPWEHLNMVRMRAIENHRWVLRATNSGVTASVDPYGRVVQSAARHIRTSLRVGFGYEKDLTFYAKHGDWFAWLCCCVTGLALAAGWIQQIAGPGRI